MLSLSKILCLCSITQRKFRYFCHLGYDQFIGIVIEYMTDTSELDVSGKHLLKLHQAICAFGEGFSYWKGLVVGMCDLLSTAEPSQNRKRRARNLISGWANKLIDRLRSQWILRSKARQMGRSMVDLSGRAALYKCISASPTKEKFTSIKTQKSLCHHLHTQLSSSCHRHALLPSWS